MLEDVLRKDESELGLHRCLVHNLLLVQGAVSSMLSLSERELLSDCVTGGNPIDAGRQTIKSEIRPRCVLY